MFTHHKPRPGFVYVVRRDGDEFKIGSTESNLRTRLTLLASKMKRPMVFCHAIPSECPKLLERRLHDRLRVRHVGGEWFALVGPESEWVTTLDPNAARAYVPEAGKWYTPDGAAKVYTGLAGLFARTMGPNGRPGRFADMMSEYWATALGVPTDAFRQTQE